MAIALSWSIVIKNIMLHYVQWLRNSMLLLNRSDQTGLAKNIGEYSFHYGGLDKREKIKGARGIRNLGVKISPIGTNMATNSRNIEMRAKKEVYNSHNCYTAIL